MLYEIARPVLFSLDPETAHETTLAGLNLAGRLLPAARPLPAKPVEVVPEAPKVAAAIPTVAAPQVEPEKKEKPAIALVDPKPRAEVAIAAPPISCCITRSMSRP